MVRPAAATISFVNKDKGSVGSGTNTVTTTGISHTAGNALITTLIWTNALNVTANTPTDTAGDTFTCKTARTTGTGTNSRGVRQCYVLSTAGNATNQVTQTTSSNAGAMDLYVVQFSTTTAPFSFDVECGGTGTSTTPSCSLTAAQSGEAIVAGAGNEAGGTSYTAGSGFTLDYDDDFGFTGYYAGEHAITGGTVTAGFTIQSSQLWAVAAIALKDAAGGGGGCTPGLLTLGVGKCEDHP